MCTGMTSFNQPDGWISVNDRLPVDGRDVIGRSDTGVAFECWYCAEDDRWIRRGVALVGCITHWRELPAPPKTEGDLNER